MTGGAVRRKCREFNGVNEVPNRFVLMTIDLASPEGNAYALVSVARHLAALTGQEAGAITGRMMHGTYDHLVAVFDEYFGEFIELKNNPKGIQS
jgi:hypothetical protein